MMKKYLALILLLVVVKVANADGFNYEQLHDNPNRSYTLTVPDLVFKIISPANKNITVGDIKVYDTITKKEVPATNCAPNFYTCYDLGPLLAKKDSCILHFVLHYKLSGKDITVDHLVVVKKKGKTAKAADAANQDTDQGSDPVNAPAGKTIADIKATGIAYYDAITLNKLITNSGLDSLTTNDLLLKSLEILSKYNQGDLTAGDTAELIKNIFLKDFITKLDSINNKTPGAKILRVANAHSSSFDLSGLSSGLSTFATGTDITPYVKAIADFLAERMKEEITTALIDRMKQMLDTVPELKYMLPNTYNTFTNTDPFLIPTMGQVYKQSFLKDIENTAFNFEAMVNALPKYNAVKLDPAFIIFMSSYHAVDLFSKGNALPDVLQQVDDLYGADSAGSNTKLAFQRTLRIARLVSDGVRNNTDTAHAYVKAKDLASLSTAEMKIFMGLLYQQDSLVFNNYMFIKPIGGDSNLTKVIYHNLANFQKTVNRLVTISINIDAQVNAIKRIENTDSLDAKQKQQKEITYFLRNCDVLNDVLDFALSIPYFKNPDEYRTSAYYTQWKPIVQDALAIAKAIPDKNYGLIVSSSVDAITKVVNNVLDKRRAKLDSLVKAGSADMYLTKKQIKDSINAVKTLKASVISGPGFDALNAREAYLVNLLNTNATGLQAGFKDIAGISKFVEKLSFFYNFITDMANADSSVAIKKILEKYADPPGSYKIKRNSSFSISLNAYPGLYSGVGLQKGVPHLASSVSGVTAPIGIAFSWCSNKLGTVLNQSTSNLSKAKDKPYLNKTGWSHSLFIGIIDVGAALNLKLSRDSVSLPNKVTVLQIFSPGIFYSLGIKGAPVSINLGGQLLPQLHQTISDKGQSVVDASNIYWLGCTLSIDIPVFHFVRKETKILGY